MSRLLGIVLSAAIGLGVAGCCGGRDKPDSYDLIDNIKPTATLTYDSDIADGKLRLTAICDDSPDRDKILLERDESCSCELWREVKNLGPSSGLNGATIDLSNYSAESNENTGALKYDYGVDDEGKPFDWYRIEMEFTDLCPGYQGFYFDCNDYEGNQGVRATLGLYLYSDMAIDASLLLKDTTKPEIQFEVQRNAEGYLVWDNFQVQDLETGLHHVAVFRIDNQTLASGEIYYHQEFLNRQLTFDLTSELPPIHFSDDESALIVAQVTNHSQVGGVVSQVYLYYQEGAEGDDDDSANPVELGDDDSAGDDDDSSGSNL